MTILYYTSNRENPQFEWKIQKNILENSGELPIISVSQKPLRFGKNICVGDIGHSYESQFEQILIGAKEAVTEYLIFAEADFLYPKEYFEFEPIGDSVYRNENVYLAFTHGRYYKKPFSIGTQICKREDIVKHGFKEHVPFTRFKTKIPCVSFKTGNSMTAKNHLTNVTEDTLPYWGTVWELRKKYL